jgi:hypothetical protein
VRARGSGSGVRRLCHGQELTAAAGPRPKRNRTEERQCCVVRAHQEGRKALQAFLAEPRGYDGHITDEAFTCVYLLVA